MDPDRDQPDELKDDDHAVIECECDRCGRTFLWQLDDCTTMQCPTCEPDADP
jgi:hypothetical protein